VDDVGDPLRAHDSALRAEGGGLSPLTCAVPGFLIVVALAVAGGLLLVNCLRATPATSYTTRIEALPVDEPVFLSGPGIYLVRTAGGVIALDQHEPRREDASRGCVIRWREALERDGRRGFFRSDCTGTLYDLSGAPVEGAGPPMKRHPTRRDGDRVTVDFKACIDPSAGNAVVPCRP
jgi:hypothetical protein